MLTWLMTWVATFTITIPITLSVVVVMKRWIARPLGVAEMDDGLFRAVRAARESEAADEKSRVPSHDRRCANSFGLGRGASSTIPSRLRVSRQFSQWQHDHHVSPGLRIAVHS